MNKMPRNRIPWVVVADGGEGGIGRYRAFANVVAVSCSRATLCRVGSTGSRHRVPRLQKILNRPRYDLSLPPRGRANGGEGGIRTLGRF
jgi:hypothetical protein